MSDPYPIGLRNAVQFFFFFFILIIFVHHLIYFFLKKRLDVMDVKEILWMFQEELRFIFF